MFVRTFGILAILAAVFALSYAAAENSGEDPARSESKGQQEQSGGSPPQIVPQTAPQPKAPISIASRAEPDTAALGEIVTVIVQINHPTDVVVRLSELTSSPAFEVKPLSFETLQNPEGNLSIAKYTAQIFGFDAEGKAGIPPARFKLFGPGLENATIDSPPLSINVKTLMPKEKAATAEIEDVAAWRDLLRPNYGPLFALIGLLLVGAAYLAYYIHRKTRPSEEAPEAPPPPPIPADELALNKLKLIVAKEYLKKGDFESYYFEISEVVREFLGNLYGFDSIEMTSEELLQTLSATPTPGLDILRLRSFLSHTDLVKFSETLPTMDECSQILDDAYYFVQTCKASTFKSASSPSLAEKRYGV